MEYRYPSLVEQAALHDQYRASRRAQKQKSVWYWLVVFPIKWSMILVFGLAIVMLAVSVGLIFLVPWGVVRGCRQL